MKFTATISLLLGFYLFSPCSFGQDIAFGYDDNGNRIERKIVILNERSVASSIDATKEQENIPILYRELKVYPNPTLGQVKVELPVTENDAPFTYRVLTTTGQVILSGLSANGVVDFDLSAQPVGIYFVALRNASTTYNLQIVRQ